MTVLMRLEVLCLLVIVEDISFHSCASRIAKASIRDHGLVWVECFNLFLCLQHALRYSTIYVLTCIMLSNLMKLLSIFFLIIFALLLISFFRKNFISFF